ncbi:MAG: septation regulator SpoVG [Clostridia bacterium]|nr:septation regulator SpoVG [Clostridia bacterium]
MQVTDIRVRKVNSVGKMKAVVSVTFDGCFVVHDIKVIEGKERLFIAMPSRKTAEGEFKDVAHPISSELRDELQSLILAKYEEALLETPTEEA